MNFSRRRHMLRWFVPFLLVLVTAGPLATLAYSPDSEKQAIRAVIESVSSAIDSADLPLLLAQFAEDAVIDSKIARAKVSKQKYAEAMAAAFRTHELIGMEIRDIKITMVDPTIATVLTTMHPMTRTRRYIYDHEWKLEKRDGRWLIVETNYRPRVEKPVEGGWA
jgi:uncharacterized protein (TIGR02246 family)